MAIDTEAIWKDFDAKLRRFILRRVSNEADAEDILQEVYLKIHTHLHTLRDDNKIHSWIFQIVRNVIVDYYRSKEQTVEISESLTLPEGLEGNDVVRELAPSLLGMISCLPKKYRYALYLTEYRGFTQKELAEYFNISLSGAKSRVQRAREKVKELLLECCHFDFDRQGRIIDYYPTDNGCADSKATTGCKSES